MWKHSSFPSFKNKGIEAKLKQKLFTELDKLSFLFWIHPNGNTNLTMVRRYHGSFLITSWHLKQETTMQKCMKAKNMNKTLLQDKKSQIQASYRSHFFFSFSYSLKNRQLDSLFDIIKINNSPKINSLNLIFFMSRLVL